MNRKEHARKPSALDFCPHEQHPQKTGSQRVKEDGNNMIPGWIHSKELPLDPKRTQREREEVRRRGSEPKAPKTIHRSHGGIGGYQVVVIPKPFPVINRSVNPEARENDQRALE